MRRGIKIGLSFGELSGMKQSLPSQCSELFTRAKEKAYYSYKTAFSTLCTGKSLTGEQR